MPQSHYLTFENVYLLTLKRFLKSGVLNFKKELGSPFGSVLTQLPIYVHFAQIATTTIIF